MRVPLGKGVDLLQAKNQVEIRADQHEYDYQQYLGKA